jgi:intracellular multiplication protein IcmQ
MKNNKLSDEQIEAVLAAFQDALDQGPWASSSLLRVLGKKLQGIHDDFEAQVHLKKKAVTVKESQHHSQKKPDPTQQEIFVSLYSTDGGQLKSWEQILITLPKQMLSRPIYAEEEAIKKAIKTRDNQVNEAYLVIYINKQSLLTVPDDRTPKDRLGSPLLILKNNALSLDKIVRFVHLDNVYTYARGRLTQDLSANNDS